VGATALGSGHAPAAPRPSAAPTALQEILPQALTAVPQSSLQPSPRAVPAAQAARHQPPALSVPCGAGLWPAGCRQGWPAAGAGRAAHPVLGSVEKAVDFPILLALWQEWSSC
jgi:hypothetical protein